MPSQDSVIRLILVEDRLEDAEGIISILRNGGMAVRPARPESAEELAELVAKQPPDLVLASWSGKGIPFAEVMRIVGTSSKDLPVVAISGELGEAVILESLQLGARNVALRSKPEHVQHVVRSQFAALENRRAVRRLEAMLRETERRCDALIDSSRDPIAYVHEGMHIRANQAYLEMFGYESFEEIEGLPVLDMLAGQHAEEFKQLLKRMSRGEPPPKTLELKAQRADGETFDAVMEFAQASYEGEPCLQIIFRQQTIDAEMAKELDELRQRDPVTGLFNRTHFLGEVESAVAEAASGAGDQALFLIEIDNYASLLNDIGLGHADELLQGAAGRLQQALGANAIAARFSDHSFAVLCRKSDHNHSKEQADRLRAAFPDHILEVGERSLNVTISVGGVQIGEKIASVPQVLGKASQCLQAASSDGGNRCQIYDPAARDRAEEERIQEWVGRIQAALKGNDFLLHYQPIIGLQGNEVELYEVLLRMKHGNSDIIPPLSFLPIAEEYGLMDDIDRWVIARSIQTLAEQHKAGRKIALLVKITPQGLTESSNLGTIVTELVRRSGVPGERLIFEIPESKAFTNLKPVQEFTQAVSRVGASLCLAQFGSGLNSFQLLKHIDARYLKLDRSFMQDLAKNPESQKKVKELAAEAQKQDRRTIAEFVSDAASLTILYTSSVDYVEGHFLASAAPEMNYDFSAF
jgi:multidomain signaling protein FimX